jgi:threonine dehydratase
VERVTRADVLATEPLIRSHVRRTPVLELDRAELGLPPGRLVLKLEHLQHSGSFKPRGAFANVLSRDPRPRSIVAASGGNHGAAVAYVAQRLGIPAMIFVPEISNPAKVARIRGYGADPELVGQTYGEALDASREWARGRDAAEVHAYDARETVMGAGSLALELQEQAPDVRTVIAAVGGGGLLGGVAAGYDGTVRVVGAEPDGAPTLTRALAAGQPVDSPTGSIAVDSLAPRQIGEHPFAVLQALDVDATLVSDDEIVAAQRTLWDRLRLAVEPGGATAFAALLAGRSGIGPEPVAVVISGANTTAVQL